MTFSAKALASGVSAFDLIAFAKALSLWSSVSDMKKSEPAKATKLHPNAWARFERAVDVVAKSAPQPRSKTDHAKSARSKKPRKQQRSG